MPTGGGRPFSTQELKKVIGEPQFSRNAKVEVLLVQNPTVLRVNIPLADGNPDSRVYAYDVVVIGKDPRKCLFKSVVYFEGVNLGVGHEPNGGVTTVDILHDELPEGKAYTIAIRPISSLGTKGYDA